MLNRILGVGAVAAVVLLGATAASAQTGYAQDRATAALLPPVTRALVPSNFAVTPLQEVTEQPRKHDSPWNGLLIGAALGAAIGFGTYTECTPEPPEKICGGNLSTSRGMETAVAAAVFGAMGLTLDLVLDPYKHAQRAPVPARPGFSVGVTRTGVQAQFGKRF